MKLLMNLRIIQKLKKSNDEKIKNLELQLSKQKNLIRLTGIGIIVAVVILLVVT